MLSRFDIESYQTHSHAYDSLDLLSYLTPMLYFKAVYDKEIVKPEEDNNLKSVQSLEAIRICRFSGAKNNGGCLERFHHVPTPNGICSAFNSRKMEELLFPGKVGSFCNVYS